MRIRICRFTGNVRKGISGRLLYRIAQLMDEGVRTVRGIRHGFNDLVTTDKNIAASRF